MDNTPDEEFVIAQLFEDLQTDLESSNCRPAGLYTLIPYIADFDLAVAHLQAVMNNEETLCRSEFVSEHATLILPDHKTMVHDLINTFQPEEGVDYLTALDFIAAGLGYELFEVSFNQAQKKLGNGLFSMEHRAIIVDDSLSLEGQRETVARLIGRVVISTVVGDGELFDNPTSGYSLQKWCNSFAYELLMPGQFVRDLYMRGKSAKKMCKKFQVTPRLLYQRLAQLKLPLY